MVVQAGSNEGDSVVDEVGVGYLTKSRDVGVGLLRERVLIEKGGKSGDFKYTTNDEGYIKIVEYKGFDVDVVIPGHIVGREVREIGVNAFHNKKLESVAIPNTVRKIYERAFAFNNLGEIILPERLEEIGSYAFWSNNLKEVVIPDSVVILGDRGFSVNELEKVRLSRNIEDISDYAFAANRLKTLKIPEGVVRVGDGAFRESSIEELDLPDSLVDIGVNAFTRNKLYRVSFGEGLEKIGSYSFYNNSIEEIKIPDRVSFVGVRAFHGNKIKEVDLPERLSIISEGAFMNNDVSKVKIRSKEVFFEEDVFEKNVINSRELVVIGYAGTSTEEYTRSYDYTFIDGGSDVVFNPGGSEDWVKDLVVRIDVKNNDGDMLGVWSESKESINEGEKIRIGGDYKISYKGTGDVYLHVKVKNILGGADYFTSDVYKVDNKGPEILLDKSEGGYSKRHEVSVDISDDESGVGEVMYLWSKESYFPRRDSMVKVDKGGTVSISEGEGDYYLHVLAEDKVGNIAEYTSGVFKLDNEYPEKPSILVNEEWQSGEVRVVVEEGKDKLSGADYTEYRLGNGGWVLYKEPIFVKEEGEVSIEARTVDNVGNVGKSSKAVVRVDNTAPEGYVYLENKKEYSVDVGVRGLKESMSGLHEDHVKIQYGLSGELLGDYSEWGGNNLVGVYGLDYSSKYIFRALIRDKVGNIGITGVVEFLTSPGLFLPEGGVYYSEKDPTTLVFKFKNGVRKEKEEVIEVRRNGTLVAVIEEGVLFEDRRLEAENTYTYAFTTVSTDFEGKRLENEPFVLDSVKTGVSGLIVNLNEEYDNLRDIYRVYSTEFSGLTGINGGISLSQGGEISLSIDGLFSGGMEIRPRLHSEFGLDIEVPDRKEMDFSVETIGREREEREDFTIEKTQKGLSKRSIKDNPDILDSLYRRGR